MSRTLELARIWVRASVCVNWITYFIEKKGCDSEQKKEKKSDKSIEIMLTQHIISITFIDIELCRTFSHPTPNVY